MGQRGSSKALARICVIDTKVIFSSRKLVYRELHTDCNLDLRFLIKNQISMIMADLS